ncbi:sulfite exporter TauE/SafE family protein [Streptomyces sp. NPDC048506]|uniref:sulfite exporter TauE/SafE family protein n=1 Tax=Streptomyces sp. NPDC048506 TaxID=3155028 RepID=UPI00343F4DC8
MSVLLAVAALPCGLLIGLLLGALGGGGSVLAVPALVYLLGQSPHEATAGALVVVAIGAAAGLLSHARAGRVRWAAGAAFGALGTAGSFLGTRWSAAVAPDVLMAAFAGLMLVVAALLLIRALRDRRAAGAQGGSAAGPEGEGGSAAGSEGEGQRAVGNEGEGEAGARDLRPPPDRPRARRSPARSARVAVTASAVGLLTGFFGVGGGFVVVPALTLVLGLEMPVAIGTSLLVILVNSLTALATRAGTGALDWPLLAGFAACAALGSHLGNRLTARLRPQTLTAAFASVVLVLAVTMAATALPRL